MKEKVPNLIKTQDLFVDAKSHILLQWVSYDAPKTILTLHKIDEEYFINKYASGVFDYFMGVITGRRELGNCPIMEDLLVYLKHREISADELFEICSHFRRSMIDFSYDAGFGSKEIFDEISYIFDKNFKGILKFYTDAIFDKLEEAKQEAVQAGQAKEYFLSNMSHEIRTPLNAILGFVYLLLDDDLSKKQRNYLDIILSSGENLLSIINDILDFSKLRSGEFSVEPKIFSLHEELSHSMELFVASATSKDITITSFIDPMIPKELYADALRIKQILSNFLSNAVKFTDYGSVQLSVILLEECDKGLLRLRFEVKDSGIGMDETALKNIFSPFEQVTGSERMREGTGLGLSISRKLVQMMESDIQVGSELGEGSVFWFELELAVAT